MASSLQIDLSEAFRSLGDRAPIVEAVIECRAIADDIHVPGEPERIKLQAHLTEYPHCQTLRAVNLEVAVNASAGTAQGRAAADLSRGGFLLRSADHGRVAQFRRDGFSLSWLKPYRDFATFLGEAMSLWKLHREVVSPGPIDRLGLRYINQIPLPHGGLQLEECIRSVPAGPEGLNLSPHEFLHQDTYVIPGLGYRVKLVVVSIPSAAGGGSGELCCVARPMTETPRSRCTFRGT